MCRFEVYESLQVAVEGSAACTAWKSRPYEAWPAGSFSILGKGSAVFATLVSPVRGAEPDNESISSSSRERRHLEKSSIQELEKSARSFQRAGMTANAKVVWNLAAEFYSARYVRTRIGDCDII